MERCLICGKQMVVFGSGRFPRCLEHGMLENQIRTGKETVERYKERIKQAEGSIIELQSECIKCRESIEKYRAALQTVRSYVSGVKGPERPVVLATIDEALGE